QKPRPPFCEIEFVSAGQSELIGFEPLVYRTGTICGHAEQDGLRSILRIRAEWLRVSACATQVFYHIELNGSRRDGVCLGVIPVGCGNRNRSAGDRQSL